jgi:hypothetical protein
VVSRQGKRSFPESEEWWPAIPGLLFIRSWKHSDTGGSRADGLFFDM